MRTICLKGFCAPVLGLSAIQAAPAAASAHFTETWGVLRDRRDA
jgi:hypothetical protein